jgi:hypothetical protein
LRYEFTGRRALAIWATWTAASAVAWLAVHPLGSTAERDVLLLLAGGALASVLHGFVLWSRTLGQDVRLAWLVASLLAWAVAGVATVVVPWQSAFSLSSDGGFVIFVAAVGLLVGAGQAWALGHLRRSRTWVLVPACALVAAFFLATGFSRRLEASGVWAAVYADADARFRTEGLLYGAAYGALTGAAFVWVGRGQGPPSGTASLPNR